MITEDERKLIVKRIDDLETKIEHIYDVIGTSVDALAEIRDMVTHPESEKHLRCPRCTSKDYDHIKEVCPHCQDNGGNHDE